MNSDKTQRTEGKMSVQPRYLKTRAAAEYIGVSRRYLCQLASEGSIRHSRIGPRTQLFAVRDLDAFVAGCAIGGSA